MIELFCPLVERSQQHHSAYNTPGSQNDKAQTVLPAEKNLGILEAWVHWIQYSTFGPESRELSEILYGAIASASSSRRYTGRAKSLLPS